MKQEKSAAEYMEILKKYDEGTYEFYKNRVINHVPMAVRNYVEALIRQNKNNEQEGAE